ncbi:GNAT family N-acetyltransferase [Arthrobacter globiformis]|uniref:GNAT family N-acetyltransferase n=1 Tax=Arthrobacter globiformis TaxID=1665 RepID=UPI0015544730|nr:GNAT family N-acetyltransferase [Arthrobacter globiformis]
MVEKLHEEHDVSRLICGLPSVDEWLQNQARANARHVATHVCVDGAGAVVGFFALKTVIVATAGYSSRIRNGSQEGQSVGILLCQMGLDKPLQGSGHGKLLLRRALAEAVAAHEISPVQLFLVDAANEDLIEFYKFPGMQLIPNTTRLIAPMGAVVKAVKA